MNKTLTELVEALECVLSHYGAVNKDYSTALGYKRAFEETEHVQAARAAIAKAKAVDRADAAEYVQRGNDLYRTVGNTEVKVECRWLHDDIESHLTDQWGFVHQVEHRTPNCCKLGGGD